MNIIITGASKGLGKAIAAKFAEAGYSLFICSRNELELNATRQLLSTRYPQCSIQAMPVDMSRTYEVQSFAQWCLSFGKPDILVNNAGQFLPGSVHNEQDGLLEQMINVNLYSAYNLTRALLPSMMEAKQGYIFNICSIASLQAYANGGAYSISKFALLGFSKNLREELKPFNIKVTSVIPGAAYTDSWIGSGINPQRIMEANDIAEMIYAATLLSPQACVEDIVLRPQLGDL